MNCPKCNQQLDDNIDVCPYCGQVIEKTVKPVTFKETTKSLFTELFVFNGKIGRRFFIYQVLFLFLISMAISMLGISFSSASLEEIATLHFPDNFFDGYNLANFVIALLYAIFLAAPVYRRTNDAFDSKNVALVFTIFFLISQLYSTNILSFVIKDSAIFNPLDNILAIVSIVGSVMLLICIFKRGHNQ